MTVRSQRGREKFAIHVMNNFMYLIDSAKVRFLLNFSVVEQIGLLKARIHTRNREVVKKIKQYSHFPLSANVQVVRFVMGIKQQTEKMVEGTTDVTHLCTSNLSSVVHAVILRTESL